MLQSVLEFVKIPSWGSHRPGAPSSITADNRRMKKKIITCDILSLGAVAKRKEKNILQKPAVEGKFLSDPKFQIEMKKLVSYKIRNFNCRKRISSTRNSLRGGPVLSLRESISVTEFFSITSIVVASRFSSDVLELFYGSILQNENKRQRLSMEPVRIERGMDCELLRNNFSEWLRVWKITVLEGSPYKADLLKFAQKNNNKIY